MDAYPRTWVVSFELSRTLELHSARVELVDEAGTRQIIRMATGPFDSPEDILATLLELIEHAEYTGEQLRLPDTVLE